MKQKFYNALNYIKRQRFLNNIFDKWRDIHTIMFFFIFCFWILVWKLFSYTVLNYETYKALADRQQIWTFPVPVNRWIIYSSIEKWNTMQESNPLATSINLYDLAIDPSYNWNREKLWEFLIELVYEEICLNKNQEKCKNNLLKFLSVLELEDFEYSPEYIKKKISEKIIAKVMQTKITNVNLWSDFSKEQISKLKDLKIRGFYFWEKTISVNPEEYTQTPENLVLISEIIWITPEELKSITRKWRELKYTPILKKISINSSEKIKDIRKEEREAVNKKILPRENSIYWFFITNENPSRYYPEWDIASQIVGFIDSEWVWRYWLEWYFNNILKGNNWKIVAKKDVSWRIIDTISIEKDDLLWEWVKIITTIDRNIQKKVEDVLREWVIRYRANKWTIVVTEPNTGRVLAMANYPTYDINNFWDVSELEKVTRSKYPNPSNDLLGYPIFVEDNVEWKKFIYDSKEIFLRKATPEEVWNSALVKYKYKNGFWPWVYRNDAISSLYEPGSIMKSITVAIWLDTWEIDVNSKYDDRWSVKIDNFEIKNESKACLWYHTFGHALDYSCNVWMIRIFQRVWKALASEYFEAFGFWEPTWIELEWEIYAPLWAWEKWPLANLFTKSYWLWISVTPLQMAAAYNVLANWWVYVKPRIIEKIIYPNWAEIVYKTEEKRRVIKQETSDIMKKMLQNWIDNWLAEKWAVAWYSLWWKTWTAQILFRGKYQSGPGWTNASYAWFWPVEDPKFVIIVKLERPRTEVYWSQTSGQMFSDVASYLLDYYGIPRSRK